MAFRERLGGGVTDGFFSRERFGSLEGPEKIRGGPLGERAYRDFLTFRFEEEAVSRLEAQ
jgi:hypothetical protein